MDQSPSESAMNRFLETAPDFREPTLVQVVPGMPTLPQLKAMAQARKAEGLPTVDQSAGDIDALGKPLDPQFLQWRREFRDLLKTKAGDLVFPHKSGEVDGYPAHYQMAYPEVVEILADSFGIKGPHLAVQTSSGRNALSMLFHALRLRALSEKGMEEDGALAMILDPMAWSGYTPLADDLGIHLINSPGVKGHSLGQSAEGLKAAIEFAKTQELSPAGIITVIPSNPTGLGMPAEELQKMLETAAESKIPLLVDAFYSPLDPEGHRHAVNFEELENLPPEILQYLGILVGETKVTHSQIKTATAFWMSPKGYDGIAKDIIGAAQRRMSATNTYPVPPAALTAAALHTFKGGIHEAMGERWNALQAARNGLRRMFDSLGLPLTIGDSFYGMAALVDAGGNSLIRDDEGRPIDDPVETVRQLVKKYGLVPAPGITFRSSLSAAKTMRLTATASTKELVMLQGIFEQMIREAQIHG